MYTLTVPPVDEKLQEITRDPNAYIRLVRAERRRVATTTPGAAPSASKRRRRSTTTDR